MKSMGTILLGFLLLAALAATQERRVAGNTVPAYSTAQEQTISGTVQEVKDYQCPVTGTIGAHITVKGGADLVEVHIAPATFLREYGIVLKAGDSVKVTGVKFVFEGKPAMLARTIVDGQSTFTFRSDKGQPEW